MLLRAAIPGLRATARFSTELANHLEAPKASKFKNLLRLPSPTGVAPVFLAAGGMIAYQQNRALNWSEEKITYNDKWARIFGRNSFI